MSFFFPFSPIPEAPARAESRRSTPPTRLLGRTRLWIKIWKAFEHLPNRLMTRRAKSIILVGIENGTILAWLSLSELGPRNLIYPKLRIHKWFCCKRPEVAIYSFFLQVSVRVSMIDRVFLPGQRRKRFAIIWTRTFKTAWIWSIRINGFAITRVKTKTSTSLQDIRLTRELDPKPKTVSLIDHCLISYVTYLFDT